MKQDRIKICLVAPSGSGKSTVAGLINSFAIENNISVKTLKLAQPLYHIQNELYRIAGIDVDKGAQNHSIMEDVADWLRGLNPNCIADNFINKLSTASEQLIVNDDIRDSKHDWPMLKKVGFEAVSVFAPEKIRFERMQNRLDLSTPKKSKLDSRIEKIPVSHTIDNSSNDLGQLRLQVEDYLNERLALVELS